MKQLKNVGGLVLGLVVLGGSAVLWTQGHFVTSERFADAQARIADLTAKLDSLATDRDREGRDLAGIVVRLEQMDSIDRRLARIEDQLIGIARASNAPVVVRRSP